MKIYNNTSYPSQAKTLNATSVASKGILKSKNRGFCNKDLIKKVEDKFLAETNNPTIQKFLEKYDVRLLFKTNTRYDGLYGKHFVSTFKVKKKPVKGNFLTNLKRVLVPSSTIYEAYYESGESHIRIEQRLGEDVLEDFNNVIKPMKKI